MLAQQMKKNKCTDIEGFFRMVSSLNAPDPSLKFNSTSGLEAFSANVCNIGGYSNTMKFSHC